MIQSSIIRKEKARPRHGGPSQYIKSFGRGVAETGTAGHGGIRISLALAKKRILPKVLNKAIKKSKYYFFEEDCAYALAVLSLPERFDDKMKEYAHENARDWFPDEYTLITQKPVKTSESMVLRRREFEVKTRDKFVAYSASGDWKAGVPKGMVQVHARRAADGEHMVTLITVDEYETRGVFGYVFHDE